MGDLVGKKVLVVDDEDYLTAIWKEIFRLIDIEVLTAASGKEGISVLKESHVELVITDLRMRGSDGFDLLNYIKNEAEGDITTIVCSGFYNERSDELSLHNIKRFIPKPFNVKEELAFMQNVLSD